MNKHSRISTKNKSGISMIMLVVIIVITLLLASAIVLTVSRTNPIKEARIAKYKNDRDNIQSVLTNTIAKIVTENRGTVKIIPGVINDIKIDARKSSGEISYTITNAASKHNANGRIIFAKGDNTSTEYYTGYRLPVYGGANTEWYADENGKVSVKVEGTTYGPSKWISENDEDKKEGE